jgi:hypothetical protein
MLATATAHDKKIALAPNVVAAAVNMLPIARVLRYVPAI